MLKGHLPRVMYHQVYQYTKVIRGSDLLQKTVGEADHVHQLLEPAVEVGVRGINVQGFQGFHLKAKAIIWP